MTDDDDGKTIFQPASVQKKGAMQFEIGDVLNDVYEIKRFIAKGGMGEVYEAVNVHNLDERVAIKVMLPEFAADERVIAMFAKEAGTLTRLHHEAIVPYRLSSRDKLGRPFIVTAYVDGPSLEDQFKEFSPTEEELGNLTRRLAEGLGKAHSLGAIHRDIAPDNVLLVDGNPGLPKIIDFGIAQDARTDQRGATIIGDGFAGKLNYVAPEQLGEYGRKIGPWTDIYSLALTLLAVATQKHADMGGSIASAVKKRMTVPDVSSIPQRYRRAFEAALQPEPTKRPQTMKAFVKLMDIPVATETFSAFAPLNSEAQTGAIQDVKERSKKVSIGGKRKIIGTLIGLVVLITAIFAFMIPRGLDDVMPQETVINTEPPKTEVETPIKLNLTPEIIETAATETPCSWLALDGKDRLTTFNPTTDSLKILGGAGNIASARTAISRSLSRSIGQDVNIDFSEVASFSPTLCEIVEVIKDVRTPTPYIHSNETMRVFEVRTHKVPDGSGGLGDAIYTTIRVEVANIEQSKFISVMSIDPRGLLVPLVNGSKQIKWLIERHEGEMRDDGFTLSFPTSLNGTEKEGYGFVIISGDNEIPSSFFNSTNKKGGFPLSQNWISEFTSLSRANNWTSDIFWYSLVNEVDD